MESLFQQLADRYRVERQLGQGGMATVYLAHDVRHGRNVALKVLRPELAAVVGAARFLAEIRTTATLQHPHILSLFDSGEAAGLVYYVMPFVDGESLRDRLDRERQLGIEDALRIATEVADALDYAHGHGVIHRDIKPENILIHGDHALVADFGIALAATATAGTRMTETGMSLGTPTYMSPEQAMGERTVDARSDVYALGCVLYEMLTGDPPFTGSTAQAIVAKVMIEKPVPPRTVRDTVPPAVEAAVLKALAKLPADRFPTAGAFARTLRSPAAPILAGPSGSAPSGRLRLAVGAVALAGLSLAAGWWVGHRDAPESAPVARFELAARPKFGGGAAGTLTGGTRTAWAPDGRTFAYVGADSGPQQIYLRSLESMESVPVQGTVDGSSPFFSPDGTEIGFFRTTPFAIRIVARGGGAREIVNSRMSGGGADWGQDGYIYFDGGMELARIRPDGTGRESVAVLDTTRLEAGLAWPHVLPGGRGVLFRVRRVGDPPEGFTIWAVDLKTHQRHSVVAGLMARYVPPGYLVYVTADGSLMGARFDLATMTISGAPVSIATGLDQGLFGSTDLAVSPRGDLLYAIGRPHISGAAVYLDRRGVAEPVDPAWKTEGLGVTNLALSPDGTRLAIEARGAVGSGRSLSDAIWVKQLPTGPMFNVTGPMSNLAGGAQQAWQLLQNIAPTWSGDGTSLLFVSAMGGLPALYRQRADGGAPAEKVAADERGLALGIESKDGAWILAQTQTDTPGDGDILALKVGTDPGLKPLIATPARETHPALSPDGKWIAYDSNESGSTEVYVRPFPSVGSGRWQVSVGGGTWPRWSPRGDELFWRTAGGDMMAATVHASGAVPVSDPHRLFQSAAFAYPYQPTADGRRFVMLAAGTGGQQESRLVLVQNLVADLRKRLP